MSWQHDSLDRTALLVSREVYPHLDPQEITEALLATRVRFVGDAENLSSPAAQTALTTALVLTAELGAQVVLNIPNIATMRQPPLGPAGIRDELMALAGEVISPASLDNAAGTDLTFIWGDTPEDRPHAGDVYRCAGDDWSFTLADDPGVRWLGEGPFGGLLAGIAIAVEVFRGAMRRLASDNDGITPLNPDANRPFESIAMSLPSFDLDALAPLGAIDFISAGAITNSAIFALLRVAGLRGFVRVVDEDRFDLTNLNRYPLMRRFMSGHLKAHALCSWSTSELILEPIHARFNDSAMAVLGHLSDRVIVGVDNIRSRWDAQRHSPRWLGVTGTSGFTVVDSEHVAGGPCAACLHWRDDDGTDVIPTVSFVSALAGVLQAYRLLASHADADWSPQILASPLHLASPDALLHLGVAADRRCPLRCAASRALNEVRASGQRCCECLDDPGLRSRFGGKRENSSLVNRLQPNLNLRGDIRGFNPVAPAFVTPLFRSALGCLARPHSIGRFMIDTHHR